MFNIHKIVGILFRVSAIGTKFLLILFLGFYYSLEDVGLYGLVAAIAGYSIYFLGFELHSVVNREGIKDYRSWAGLIKKQNGIFCVSSFFLSVLAMIYIVFYPNQMFLVICIFILCLVEYSGQENYRRYIALLRPLEASLFIFVRNALWPFLFISYYFISEDKPKIEFIFILWILVGGFFNILSSIHMRVSCFKNLLLPDIDVSWFLQKIKISLIFLASILVMRGVAVGDRVLVSFNDTDNMLGIYVFYTSIAAAVGALLNFMGAAQSYPKLIKAIKDQSGSNYWEVRRSMFTATMGAAIIGAIAVPIFFLLLRNMIDNELLYFESYLMLFSLIMIGVVLSALNMYLHYVLYCHGEDKKILITNLVAIFSAITFVAILAFQNDITAITVSIAVIVFYISGLVTKYYFVRLMSGV